MTRPTRPVSAILVTLAVATAAVLGAGPAPTPAPAPATGQAVAAPITATVGGDVKREMTEVPVRRVVLFSSGVGFFQHAGKVTGNAATELRFKTDQINDILKSLVVGDSAGGDVKSITYGSQNPVARTLKSFQIDISSNPTMAGILNQIRGSKVTVTMPDEKVEGTILGVEEKDRPVGPADNPNLQRVIKVSYVNLITSTGIRSVQLEEVKRLQIQDEALQKELDQALAALAQARDKDKKPVIVNFDGTGERNVGIAYLVETPVWKTSYRLILPDPTSQDSATLLGWAIVENQTDNDWNNITLDLVGGRPISFIQDLYQPLYVPRPKVASKTYASLTPQTYDDGVDTSGAQPAQPGQPAPPAGGRGGRGGAGGGGGGAGGGAGGGRGGGGAGGAPGAGQGGGGFGGAGGPTDAPAEPPPMDYAQGVKSIADAGKVGEMFQYSVKGVSLPRPRSSMIPIITSPVAFDRVSIYNRSVLARNALSGVRLKNQSANYLLAGPLVVLDKVKKADGQIVESYAGDATVDDVPAGQERLLSFAIDQELLVDSNKRDPHVRVTSTSIIKGVLNFKYTDSMQQQYVLENKGDRDKQVVIEDPITVGYELKAPAKALEKTDKVYRFQVVAPAKKTVLFDVIEEKPRLETVAILPMDAATMESYSRTGDIPANVRAVLAKAAEKRRALTEVQRKLDQREQDRSRIFQDQANIRENIKVLPAGSNSAQIAITDLTTKDTERKQADADIKELQAAVEKARGELEGYLGDMTVE